MKDKEIIDLILLNIGYAVHHADWNYKNVNSPFARIYLVVEGKARLHLYKYSQALTPGHLYIVPPFTLHSYECDDYFTLFYIHLFENQFSSYHILEDYNFPVEIESFSLDKVLVERLYQINPNRELKMFDPSKYDNSSNLIRNISLHTNSPIYTLLETKGILFQLLSRFFVSATHKYEISDNRIKDIQNYIRKNIHSTLLVEELADKCHLSKDHFIRLFRQEMQMTPVKYINQKKIEQAQLMLLTSNLLIKDISFNLSFNDVSYFNRIFKAYTGITPYDYRTMYMEDI